MRGDTPIFDELLGEFIANPATSIAVPLRLRMLANFVDDWLLAAETTSTTVSIFATSTT